MAQNLLWVCENLLLDCFEYVYFLHILNQDVFDLLTVRDLTNIPNFKYENLMIYIGLYLKINLNYNQEGKDVIL